MSTDVRFRPAVLWHYLVDDYASPMKVSPKILTATIGGGRARPALINIMIAVIETSKAINKAMGRDEHYGIKPTRGDV
jgi:hypothetical protein